MPTDLITPYSRQVARLGITNACRYNIGKIYHNRQRNRGVSRSAEGRYPRESCEAVFDIVKDISSLPGQYIFSNFEIKKSIYLNYILYYIIIIEKDFTSASFEKVVSIQQEVLSVAIHIASKINSFLSINSQRQDNYILLRLGDFKIIESLFDFCDIIEIQTRKKCLSKLSSMIAKFVLSLTSDISRHHHDIRLLLVINSISTTTRDEFNRRVSRDSYRAVSGVVVVVVVVVYIYM